MKIKIDIAGSLNLDRGYGFKKQICPFDSGSCGEWCPLFGGAIEIIYGSLNKNEDYSMVHIPLCKKTLICKPEDFIDERKMEDKDTF
jgi:hypothetical protein